MKKVLLIIIVLLIILAIGQGIYYKNRPQNNIIVTNEFDNELEINSIENALYINGMLNIYTNYKPTLSIEELQRKMYEFVYINLPKIYSKSTNGNAKDIENLYKEDKMDIATLEDCIIISEQLKNIYHTGEEILLYSYEIDKDTISKNENESVSFDVIFTFDNDMPLKIKVYLSATSDNMLIRSASDLDKIYENYTGNVQKIEVLDKINTFATNANDLRTATSLKSENEKREYFDLNNELMKKLGIATQDDLISVAYQINNMNWAYGNTTFENYSIDYDSLRKEQDYDSFEVKLYFSDENEMHIIISISNNEGAEPSIKIKGNNQDILNKIQELDPNINLNEIDINNL